MEYLLTILTNGRRECFERSVYAFAQHADPWPSAVMVMDDGGQTGREFVTETIAAAFSASSPLVRAVTDWGRQPVIYEDSPAPLGMCKAHAHCWHAAAASEPPWVFHLEDDFVLLRPLALDHLRETIEAEPTLAQMALVRTPWGFEIPHGGYIPQTPGHYERRSTRIVETRELASRVYDDVFVERQWIETQRNWATNPALFRTSLAREFPWDPTPGCETEIGPRIIAAWGPDTVFGLWGWGEPWASHIGVDRQAGAYGY